MILSKLIARSFFVQPPKQKRIVNTGHTRARMVKVKNCWGANNCRPPEGRWKSSVHWRNVMRPKMRKEDRKRAILRCTELLRARFDENQTYHPHRPSTLSDTAEKATAAAKWLASLQAAVPCYKSKNQEQRGTSSVQTKKQRLLFDYFRPI